MRADIAVAAHMPSRMPAGEADMSVAEAHTVHREATSAEALVAYAAEGVHLTDAVSIIEASVAIVLISGTLAAAASGGEGSRTLAVIAGEAAGIMAAGEAGIMAAGVAGVAGIMAAGTMGIVHPGMAAMDILSMYQSIMAAMGIMEVMEMMREPVMRLVSRREYTRRNSAERCVITHESKNVLEIG